MRKSIILPLLIVAIAGCKDKPKTTEEYKKEALKKGWPTYRIGIYSDFNPIINHSKI